MMAAAVLTAALAVIMRGALLLAAAAVIPFFDRDAFSLPLFFGRLFGPGIVVDRQVDFPEDLRAFQFFRLDIFDNGRRRHPLRLSVVPHRCWHGDGSPILSSSVLLDRTVRLQLFRL